MAILLAGGAGYIGSHVAVELINAGYEPIIADNFYNSSPSVLDNLYAITGKRIPCCEIDLCDKAATARLFEQNDIQAVILCVGYKAVGESVADPLKYYRNNIDSALSVIEQMLAHGCGSIVFSSSATVYGADNVSPLTEDMPVGICANPYGTTKFFIEQILKDAAYANKALGAVLLRYFNPVGAHDSALIGEKPNGVPANLVPFITQTAAGIRSELCIFGNDYPTPDGTCIRDYIHIVDLARAHVAALEYSLKHSGVEIFNIGTGKGTSVLEMVSEFEKANSLKIPCRITGRRPGDSATSFASAAKAERMLGWRAERSLRDMCISAWRWQQNCKDK